MISKSIPNEFLLFDIVQTRLALTLDEHRREDVLRMVAQLSADGQVGDVEKFVRTLSQQPTSHELWQKLIRIATIGETYFFRDRNQLNALQFTVLRDLIEERRRTGHYQLRLWSAGCSTGEEPYTLAMMVREMLPDFSIWNIRILATDLNVSNLERAYNGVYRAWSFRAETPSTVRDHWFTAESATDYRIDNSIRQMVTFSQLNLASADYPSVTSDTIEMDVILCRNVLIYFDNFSAANVISRFHNALSENGWLILGHSESAHIVNRGFEPRNFEGAVLYQKLAPPAESEKPASNVTQPPLSATHVAKTGHTSSLSPSPALKKMADSPLSSTPLRFQSAVPGTPIQGALPSNSSSVTSKRNTTSLPSTGTLPFSTPALRSTKTASFPAISVKTGANPVPLTSPDLATAMEQARHAADSEHWSEALRWLDEAERHDKFSPQVHYLRGVVEVQKKETEKGMASLRQAIYCDPAFVMAHIALGDIYEKDGQFKKAASEWNQARENLAFLRPVDLVPCGGDMTVEMLSGLLRFRLANLPTKS